MDAATAGKWKAMDACASKNLCTLTLEYASGITFEEALAVNV